MSVASRLFPFTRIGAMTRKGSQVQVLHGPLHGPLKSLFKHIISNKISGKPATSDNCQQRRQQRVRRRAFEARVIYAYL